MGLAALRCASGRTRDEPTLLLVPVHFDLSQGRGWHGSYALGVGWDAFFCWIGMGVWSCSSGFMLDCIRVPDFSSAFCGFYMS